MTNTPRSIPMCDIASGIARQPAPTTTTSQQVHCHCHFKEPTGVDQVYDTANPACLSNVADFLSPKPMVPFCFVRKNRFCKYVTYRFALLDDISLPARGRLSASSLPNVESISFSNAPRLLTILASRDAVYTHLEKEEGISNDVQGR